MSRKRYTPEQLVNRRGKFDPPETRDINELYLRRELSTFVGPLSRSDGHDCFGLVHELVPGLAPGLNDGVVIFEDAVSRASFVGGIARCSRPGLARAIARAAG